MSFVRHVLLFSIVIDTFAVRTEHLLRCGPALSYVHLIQKVLHLHICHVPLYMMYTFVYVYTNCTCKYHLDMMRSGCFLMLISHD